MATNCLGPFLFNYFLEPILKRTAHAASHPDSVRIIWLSSFITAAPTVPPGGVQFDEEHGGPKVMKNAMQNYMQSKVGNVFLASEVANRLGIEGIISIVSVSFARCMANITDLKPERKPRYARD